MALPQSARERFDELVAGAKAAGAREHRLARESCALVQRYFDMWNKGDGSVADALLGPTYLDHAHPEVIGPAALRSLVPRYRATNPGAFMQIEIAAADGEHVAVRNRISRLVGGETVVTEGVAVFRIAAGKLAEQWSCYPEAEYVEQTPPASRATLDGWLSFRA